MRSRRPQRRSTTPILWHAASHRRNLAQSLTTRSPFSAAPHWYLKEGLGHAPLAGPFTVTSYLNPHDTSNSVALQGLLHHRRWCAAYVSTLSRVNFHGDKIVAATVPLASFPNRAGDYFFRDSLGCALGQLWVWKQSTRFLLYYLLGVVRATPDAGILPV